MDRVAAAAEQKLLGAPVTSSLLDGGRMGVQGFLYFDFSVIGPNKEVTHIPGYARTREHADPDRPNNPTYVWTWVKALSTTICQQCSDACMGRSGAPDHKRLYQEIMRRLSYIAVGTERCAGGPRAPSPRHASPESTTTTRASGTAIIDPRGGSEEEEEEQHHTRGTVRDSPSPCRPWKRRNRQYGALAVRA